MGVKPIGREDPARRRKRLGVAIKQALRELSIQLSLLNHRVSAELELKDVDLECLDLVTRHGPLNPTALARRAGLHPATMTGILDRLERGGWVARDRDPEDRRGVVIRPRRSRTQEVMRLYSGMNGAMDQICARYRDDELEVLADFLLRTAQAGRTETDALGSGSGK